MASCYSGVFLATSGSSLKDDLELIVFLCVYFPFLFFFNLCSFQEDTAAACVFTIYYL